VDHANIQLKQKEILEIKPQLEQLSQQVEIQKNELDNRQKQQTDLQKNNDDNETKKIIEQMREEFKTRESEQRNALEAVKVQMTAQPHDGGEKDSAMSSAIENLANSQTQMLQFLSEMARSQGQQPTNISVNMPPEPKGQKVKTVQIKKAPDGSYQGVVIENQGE
jgi:hypothetical protein